MSSVVMPSLWHDSEDLILLRAASATPVTVRAAHPQFARWRHGDLAQPPVRAAEIHLVLGDAAVLERDPVQVLRAQPGQENAALPLRNRAPPRHHRPSP